MGYPPQDLMPEYRQDLETIYKRAMLLLREMSLSEVVTMLRSQYSQLWRQYCSAPRKHRKHRS